MIATDQLADWLARIVQIPSVSPPHAGPRAGAPGEARLAAQVARWFADFGGEVYSEDVLPGRPNVYGIWRGRSDRWVALDVHMDTVGVEQMIGDPFSGEVRDARVYGRGAVDTKASLGVALALLAASHQAGIVPEANLLIAATVDEEHGALGAQAFARWARSRPETIDQLMVAEPTMCAPVYGHKGIVRLEFAIEGISAHTAQPQLGKNAITAAAHLVLALEQEHRRLAAAPPETPLGPPTLTVSMIAGGRGLNVVPDTCSTAIDRRIVPGERPADVTAALIALARQASPLPLTVRTLIEKDAFLQSPDSPWIRQLTEWSGQPPITVPYGTNAWDYNGLARECVVLGPGSIDQAHGDEEWVAIAELEKLASVYARWWGIAL